MRSLALLLTVSLVAIPIVAAPGDDAAVLTAAANRLAHEGTPLLIVETTRIYERANGHPDELEALIAQRSTKRVPLPPLLAEHELISEERFELAAFELGEAKAAVEFTLPAYDAAGTMALLQFARVRRLGRSTRRDLGTVRLVATDGLWRAADVRIQRSAPSGGIAPLRVGGDVKAPVVVERVDPLYTPEAREKRVQGIVIIEAVIDSDGYVADAIVLKPLPFGLDEAAIDAVKQWRFRPATIGPRKQPIDVLFNLTVNFRLE